MGDWQLTATKIYCDAVDEDVTIMVYQDWRTICTGYKKYVEEPNQETTLLLQKKAKRLGRSLKCEGPQDYRVTDYRDKLAAEDKA